MSIQNEINRIESNVSASYQIAEGMGADMPVDLTSGNLPMTIASIPSGGGTVESRVISIPVNAWVNSTAVTGFAFQAVVTVIDLDENTSITVTFDPISVSVATVAVLHPTYIRAQNTITFFSKNIPTAVLNGEVIFSGKGGGGGGGWLPNEQQLLTINSGVSSDWRNIVEGELDFIFGAQGLPSRQPYLISGENIKTINQKSILGSGNIDITGGGDGGLTMSWFELQGDDLVLAVDFVGDIPPGYEPPFELDEETGDMYFVFERQD